MIIAENLALAFFCVVAIKSNLSTFYGCKDSNLILNSRSSPQPFLKFRNFFATYQYFILIGACNYKL